MTSRGHDPTRQQRTPRDSNASDHSDLVSDQSRGAANTRPLNSDRGDVTGVCFPKTTRYQVIGEPIAGGMGVVYRAFDSHLGIEVAIKRISPKFTTHQEFMNRFEREAKTQAYLRHPNLVAVKDFDRDDLGPYIVMDWINGRSLAKALKEDGPFEWQRATKIISKVAAALKVIHDGGIIHRDIKPSNILLDEWDEPHVTDFGLVRLEASHSVASETMTGALLGAVDFVAPEQLEDPRNASVQSDIWSLGATLYGLVTGRSVRGMRERLIPREIRDVTLTAMEQDLNERFRSMTDVINALSQVGLTESAMPAVGVADSKSAAGVVGMLDSALFSRARSRYRMVSFCMCLIVGVILGIPLFLTWQKLEDSRRLTLIEEFSSLRSSLQNLNNDDNPAVIAHLKKADRLRQQATTGSAGESVTTLREALAELRDASAIDQKIDQIRPLLNLLGETLSPAAMPEEGSPWLLSSAVIEQKLGELQKRHAQIVTQLDQGETAKAEQTLTELLRDLGQLQRENVSAMHTETARSNWLRLQTKMPERLLTHAVWPAISRAGKDAESGWNAGEWNNSKLLYLGAAEDLKQFLSSESTAEEKAELLKTDAEALVRLETEKADLQQQLTVLRQEKEKVAALTEERETLREAKEPESNTKRTLNVMQKGIAPFAEKPDGQLPEAGSEVTMLANIDRSAVFSNAFGSETANHRQGLPKGTRAVVVEFNTETNRMLLEWQGANSDWLRGWIVFSPASVQPASKRF